MLYKFGLKPDEWRQIHYDDRLRLLRGLARIRAEESLPFGRFPAETSPVGTITSVNSTDELDPDRPFGIPAGELS